MGGFRFAFWKIKPFDPQLSWVRLVIHCVFVYKFLVSYKAFGCGGQKLTRRGGGGGGASGQGAFWGTFGPGLLVGGKSISMSTRLSF